MDTRTEIINEVINYLSSDFNAEQLNRINNVLYIVLDKYEVQERCTALVLTDDSADMLLKKFLATKKLEGKSQTTLAQYKLLVSNALHTIGKKVKDINTYDLRYYLAEYQERRGIANSSLENIRKCLVVFFGWLTEEGFLERDPASALKPIKSERVVRKAFSSDEMEKLRRACTNKRDRAIVEFLYCTGCRVSEVAALNRTDVNLVEKKVVVTGKGDKQRTVYLDDVATMYLTNYLQSRTDGDPCLFRCNYNNHTEGCRLKKNSYEYMLKRLGKRAGVKDVHPHRFRRTLATDMIHRGAPIQDVATILGHSQITTTQVYISIDEQQVESTYNRCIA